MGFRYYDKQQQVRDDEWQGEWGLNLNDTLHVIWARYVAFLLSFYIQLPFFFILGTTSLRKLKVDMMNDGQRWRGQMTGETGPKWHMTPDMFLFSLFISN